jgi:GNAT superfamily N-acetyltransferase
MTTRIMIDELAIPESLDTPDADDYRAGVDVHNAVIVHVLGEAAGTTTPEEMLPYLQDQQHERKRLFVARVDGEIVASAMVVWSTEPDTRVTWIDVEVLPGSRRQGVGTALFDHTEAIARESGRPIVQGGGMHLPLATGPRLDSPTGFGSLPQHEPAVRFLLNRGYTLEQVYRYSTLSLPVDEATLESLLATAQERAGSDYRVHTWAVRTPEQWLDDVAVIFMRMPTDAPSGNLEIEEKPWDPGRAHRPCRCRRARAKRPPGGLQRTVGPGGPRPARQPGNHPRPQGAPGAPPRYGDQNRQHPAIAGSQPGILADHH